MALFQKVFITDIQCQTRFRLKSRNGSVQSPAAWATGSRPVAWDDPTGRISFVSGHGCHQRLVGFLARQALLWASMGLPLRGKIQEGQLQIPFLESEVKLMGRLIKDLLAAFRIWEQYDG